MQHFVGENLVKTRGQIRLPTSRVFDVEAKKKVGIVKIRLFIQPEKIMVCRRLVCAFKR